MKTVDGTETTAAKQRADVEETVSLVPEPTHVEAHGGVPDTQPGAPNQEQTEQDPDRPLGEVILLQGVVEVEFS